MTPQLLVVGRGGIRHRAGLLELGALVDEQRGVAAVVEDHVRALAVGPGQRLLRAPPVLLERLALPGEDRDAGLGDRRARRGPGSRRCCTSPADLGAERGQRLDQHRGLDGHVQRAGDARALERLRVGVLLAGLHQAGHLVLGELDLLAAERRRGRGRRPCSLRRWRWGSCNLQGSCWSAGSGASPAPSAASRRRGRPRAARLGLEPLLDGGAQARRRGAAAARRPGRRARCRARRAARAGCAGAAARPARRAGSRTPSARARRARRARRSAACAATSPWSPRPR